MLTMGGLWDVFSIDIMNYVELMRDISPDEYRLTKDALERWVEEPIPSGFTKVWTPISIHDFISLELAFDKSHNLLRIDTLGFR